MKEYSFIPRGEFLWHHGPSAASAKDVEDGIEHFPHICILGATTGFGSRNKGCKDAHCASVNSIG